MSNSAADPSTLYSADFDIEQAKTRIEEELEKHTRFSQDCPRRLKAAIRYSLLSSGKRLRPLLVLMACRACGEEPFAALPAASAVEMIHTYSLIHDDLPGMDDDQLRRGQPTCHVKFDEATAILAGDALIPLAFEIICRDLSPVVATKCCVELGYAAGACQLVGGQQDDLANENDAGDLQQLENIHRRKTGALLTVALKLGATVAGADEFQIKSLETFGENLGLAFQIVDDLLDCRGDWTKMGKMTNKDDQQGKLTYPRLLGVEESQNRARILINNASAALEPFGTAANPLRSLAKFVLERNQ